MVKIPLYSKILNISHNDLDGSVSSIILSQIFTNFTFLETSFHKIDEILLNVQYHLYDYVILTDIHPKMEASLDISDKIILIDHHNTAIEYHNPSKNRFVVTNKGCASVLVKHWVEKLYDIKLSELDNLVHITNDYDTWTLNNPKSKMIADLQFHLYKPQKFFKEFRNGRTKLRQDELLWLKKRKASLKKECDSLNVYELDNIKGCYVEVTDFINDIADILLKKEHYEIVFIRNVKLQRTVSVRHSIKGLDIGTILKDLGWGGGHSDAAGFTATQQDVMNKIQIIEKTILERLK